MTRNPGIEDTLASTGTLTDGIPDSLRSHERYRVDRFLGAGGAGQVYLAWDKQLQRTVALKILAAQDEAQREALLREARAQARVEHPNVCKVYEIGTLADRAYISMQLIDGPTLAVEADKLALDEKIKVLRDVAEALHAAHRLGFIHRDVKPGNIMLERSDGGRLHPYVMDFGLARQLDGDTARTMGLAGTPAFMAPEQARGGSLDRRTDVYGLGATLYDVIAGHPPFQDPSTMDVLMRVIHEDAPALRRAMPSVPRDLDTVVMKCIERDPLRRYESARALAEELQRYLDGEPVQARASLIYAARKKLRKHRLVASLATVALVGAISAAALVTRARRLAAERARVGQILGRETESVDSILRYAHMLPLHDTRPEKRKVRERMHALEALVQSRGTSVPGALEYGLGRGHLALGEVERARDQLEAAWRAGFRGPDVAWALGRAYGALYQRARTAAENIEKTEQRRARLAELERTLRDPALSYLKSAAGAQTDAPSYVEALIAFYDRRDEAALQKAAQAKAAVPWLYEADQLVGDVHRRRAAERRLAGDVGAIAGELAQARVAYERARQAGRSDAALHTALCEIWRSSVQLGVDAGELRRAELDNAVAACDAAAQADPEDADALTTKAGLFLMAGKHKVNERLNGDELAQSIALARQALALDARHVEALRTLAQAATLRADAEAADPRAWLALAADALDKLLAIGPDPRAYSDLGRVYTMRGAYEAAHGQDRKKSAQLAIDSFRRAIATQPDNPVPLLNLGNVYKDLADDASYRGEDPHPPLGEAKAAFERALALNPRYAFAWNGLGTVHNILASYAAEHGGDVKTPLDQAILDFKKAGEANPRFLYAWTNLAESYCTQADEAIKHGQDPSPSLTQAREAVARAGAINDRYYYVSSKRAQIATLEADWARAHHRPTEPWLDEAAAQLGAAAAHDPEDAGEVMRNAALVELKRAEWARADGKASRAAIDAGLARARAAVRINGESAEAQSLLGRLELLAAESGEAPVADHARAAAAALSAALRANPTLGAAAKEQLARATQLAAR